MLIHFIICLFILFISTKFPPAWRVARITEPFLSLESPTNFSCFTKTSEVSCQKKTPFVKSFKKALHDKLFHDESPYHIESSEFICSVNQWTGF